jgi:hypothetical protein
MTKKNDTRFFQPAPYTRGAGVQGKRRVIYHPRRHASVPRRRLAEEGEAVEVRKGEALYWLKLLRSGDVIETKTAPSSKPAPAPKKEG